MRRWVQLLAACILVLGGCSLSDDDTRAEHEEQTTVNDTDFGPYVSGGLDRAQLHNREVLRIMSRIPRHEFVPDKVTQFAYDDRALPIGSGQTISQPFIVALMTQEARITEGSKVLEIGTGSGYQAAVLSALGARVFSIEIVPSLAEAATERIKRLGYKNITIRNGDGWQGWPEEAPFDAILVTASAPRPPERLLNQLANHGRMIIPLERGDEPGEMLTVVERRDEDFITRELGAVKFVPMTGIARELMD